MNELTAIIIYSIYPYYFIDNDMKSDNEKIKEYICNSEKYKKEIYQYFFNKNTLAGDVYLIFDMIMKNGMKDLYESKEGNSSTNNKNYKYYDLFAFKCENEEVDDHSKLKNRCDVIIKEKLNKIDGDLMNHFKKIDINCMVFLQKWIKCIFNREFTPSNVIIIWDNIIAEGNKKFEFIDFICIAILEQMKKDLINNDQDESFQIIFNFKNNDVNALNIVSEAFDLENLFYNKNKPKNESHISNSTITSSVNNKVYSSNPTSFMTPYQILDADKRENIITSQTAKPTNPIEEKLEATAHSTPSSNFPVPNFGSYFSKIGSYIKEVVSVEPGILNNSTSTNQGNINQNEMISYYPRDIADNVAHLEYFLQKTRQYLSPDEIKQYEATIRFFKLGGMCGK